MASKTIMLNGKKVVLNMDSKRVQDAIAAFIQAVSQRQFEIGSYFTHVNKDGTGTAYQLVRILQSNGTHRAYLINEDTGVARNSRKVVLVEGAKEDYPGYVTELPAEKDKFLDPENPFEYLDC